MTQYGQWIPPFLPPGPHYSDPTLRSAMRVTPSGFHIIYKGFLELRHRVVITRVSCLGRGFLAALPENLLFTRDSCNFVRARSLLASGVASSVITQVLRSLFGFFGALPRGLLVRANHARARCAGGVPRPRAKIGADRTLSATRQKPNVTLRVDDFFFRRWSVCFATQRPWR